jgi:metallo-beta-lactamase class B
MLKKFLLGVSVSVVAATLAFAQQAPEGAAGAGRAAGGAAGAGAAGAAPAGRGGNPTMPTEAQWNNSPKLAAYMAKAKEIAGTDKDLQFDVGVFCKASGGSTNGDRQSIGVPEGAVYAAFPGPNPTVPMPAQHMFDNFWWFGDSYVGAWLITDPAGYILFDASNNERDAQRDIIDQMKKVGLDPTKIKYAVYGHHHGDHTGGGPLIDKIAHPRNIMGKEDWDIYLRPATGGGGGRGGDPAAAAAAARAANPSNLPKMKRDIDAEDGMQIKVGNTVATIHQMTGHTPGSIGMIVPVKWQGKNHPILLVTAATAVPNFESFIGGYKYIWDKGIKAKVEAVYQVHPNTNMNLLARTKYVNDNFATLQKGGNNPLLYGAAKTKKYIDIMKTCTEARMDILGWLGNN